MGAIYRALVKKGDKSPRRKVAIHRPIKTKIMNNIYLKISLCFCLLPFFGQAQTLKAYQKAATKAEARQDYSEALANYQVIINSAGKETPENFYRAAENARMMRIFPLAETYYQRVLNGDNAANYPQTDYWLGHTKKRLGKYDEAITHFQNYLNNAGAAGGEKTDIANKEISDCQWAAMRTLSEDPILMNHLDDKVNSPYTEMAPTLHDNVLYFTSLRENVNDQNGFGVCESPVTKLYSSNAAGGEMAENTLLFNEGGANVAHTSFGDGGKRLYYTVCNSRNTNEDNTNCQIYYREKSGDSWGEARALPTNINLPGYNNTQPNMGVMADGTEVLFFASNRPEGQGGMDIWMSECGTGNQFKDPVNLSSLNTGADEITPFFDNKYQALYFSSEGHQNLGGFDVYRSSREGDGFGNMTHMGYPLNSSSDEIYYSTDFEAGKSYFVSNRPGGMCSDTSQYCVCNDIYMVETPNIEVKVLTFNKITNEPLFGTEVTLSADQIAGFDPQIKSLAGNHLYEDFEVSFANEFNILATKEAYTKEEIVLLTPAPLRDTVITVNAYLAPAVDLDVKTFDKLTNEPLQGVEISFVEVTDDNNLLATEMEAFGHEYDFDLNWKKKYMVIGTKAGYSADTAYVVTDGIPVVPTHLSERLFLCKNIEAFNDVVLYFDNDYPNPDSEAITTTVDYKTTYLKYIGDYNDRKGYYKSSGIHTPGMDRFFAEDVKAGYENLEGLARRLLEYFESVPGKATVEVTIKGYASLRSNADYNKKLTKRRIRSVENYFRNWVEPETGKKLTSFQDRVVVTESPFGDEQACKGCYKKEAIIDVQAAKDRRVEIISVNIIKNPCQAN